MGQVHIKSAILVDRMVSWRIELHHLLLIISFNTPHFGHYSWTMSSSTAIPSQQQIQQACVALASFLGDKKYAIVGGAALQLLGSSRTTEDVDFVVPKDAVADSRTLLAAAAGHSTVDPRTRHT